MYTKITVPDEALMAFNRIEICDALLHLSECGPQDAAFGICFNLDQLDTFDGYTVVETFFNALTGECGVDPFKSCPRGDTWGVRLNWVDVMYQAYAGKETIAISPAMLKELEYPIREELHA